LVDLAVIVMTARRFELLGERSADVYISTIESVAAVPRLAGRPRAPGDRVSEGSLVSPVNGLTDVYGDVRRFVSTEGGLIEPNRYLGIREGGERAD
jgi:hypothetical protein